MALDELTYIIRGAVFEVNRVLGPGFLEKVYERALLVELRQRGLKAECCEAFGSALQRDH